MSRFFRPDAELDQLNDERQHAAIQLSLAEDAAAPDWDRIEALQRKLRVLDAQITRHRPADA